MRSIALRSSLLVLALLIATPVSAQQYQYRDNGRIAPPQLPPSNNIYARDDMQGVRQPEGKPTPRPQVQPAGNYGATTQAPARPVKGTLEGKPAPRPQILPAQPPEQSGRAQLRDQRREEMRERRQRERQLRDAHNSPEGLPSNVQVIRQPQGTAALDVQSGTVTPQQQQGGGQQPNAEAQAALQQQMQQLGVQQQQMFERIQRQMGGVPQAYRNDAQ